jgi:alpha-tubulin suppressor-like RCC1 family protein
VERSFRRYTDSAPMRLAIVALVTFTGTLICVPAVAGAQSSDAYQTAVTGTSTVASSHVNDAARPATLQDPSGPKEVAEENVAARCGAAEEGRASAANAGSLTKPTPIVFGYGWEPLNGFEESSCTPTSKMTEAGYTQTAEVESIAPSAAMTATSSVGEESATTPEAAAGANTAAVAWGANNPAGQLGAGYEDSFEPAPVLVRDISDVSSMVPAGETSYALLDSGVVRAWGRHTRGALGNGERSSHSPNAPVAVVEKTNGGAIREMTGVTAIAAAYGAETHAMALVSDGQNEDDVMTWGASALGERGNGEYDNEAGGHVVEPRNLAIAVPALEHKHVIAIATGGTTDFALQEEEGGGTTVWAWGNNHYGQIGVGTESGTPCEGDGTTENPCEPTPQRVHLPALPAGVKITSISAGKRAAYAALSDGRVLTWGQNAYGELGDGSTENSDLPTYVCAQGHTGSCRRGPYLEHVQAISGGELSALALLEDGEVVGWGVNASGNLTGDSQEKCLNEALKACQRDPKTIEGLEGVTTISAGSEYSLAVVNDSKHKDQVYSWGSNEHGQLGDGKAKGPENCGKRNILHGQIVESVIKWCSRKPMAISGLSDVGGIAASDGTDLKNGAWAHSFAYLKGGTGPPPLLTITPEQEKGKQVLKVNWSVPSAPKSDYKLKWKAEPPGSDPHVEKAEQLEEEAAEDWALAVGRREEAEEAERAGETARAEKDIAAQTEDEVNARTLEYKRHENEKEAAAEYPPSKIINITETCARNPNEWCYTITEASNKEKEDEPLHGETSYPIQLAVVGGLGDSGMHIVGTTLP